ncbi:MAG TPA: DPP IV N-terminal domain-containing protein [bacterium]|nr:DPP IV N-terminal domain-containing protein [bacterium]
MPKKSVFLLVILALSAAAAEPTIAVVDFEAVNCDPGLARGVSELVRAGVVGIEGLRVIERAQLARIAEEQALALSGMVDESDAVEAGHLAGADLVALGSVTEIDGAYVIQLRVVDVETGEVLLGVSDTAGYEGWIPGKVRGLVESLADAAGILKSQLRTTPDEYLLGYSGSGAIVFHLAGDIHYLDLATGVGRRLTEDGLSWQSAISPDGRRLAFSSRRDGDLEIYVMNLATGETTKLTDNAADDDAPSWDPDGERIAFHSVRDGNWEIYAVDVDTRETERLTNDPAVDAYPAWSPDGKYIAFDSMRTSYTGGYEVYVMEADGEEPTRLGAGFNPEWSPDGGKIVFVRQGDTGGDLYLADPDGKNVERLTYDGGAKRFPCFTGDGETVIYDDTHTDIFALDRATGDVYRVTWNGCVVPTWGPAAD